eukprot:3687738-Prymnesium_polylepis.1
MLPRTPVGIGRVTSMSVSVSRHVQMGGGAASAARGGHWASAGPFPQPAKPPKAADGTTSPLVSRSTQADGTTSPVGVARSTNASQRRTDRHEHLRLFVVSRAMRQAQLSFHNSSSHA